MSNGFVQRLDCAIVHLWGRRAGGERCLVSCTLSLCILLTNGVTFCFDVRYGGCGLTVFVR